MMDFHCHLDLYENPRAIIEQAKVAGTYILSVTTTPKAFPGTKRMAQHSPRVRTALGLHPQLASERHTELSLFDLMLPETSYVGEIGLDGSKEHKSSLEIQTTVFRHILNSCDREGGRVLSVHSRHAADQVLNSLSNHSRKNTAILHWFSGSSSALEKANELDCWYSVGPAMLRTKSGRDRVRRMPSHRVLLETDGPFAEKDGKPLEPIQAELCIPELAEIWNCSKSEATNLLSVNLRRIGEIAGGRRT